MDKQYHYNNKAERGQKIKDGESLGLTLVTDTFDPGWKRGQEPKGTLIFRTYIPQAVEPVTDFKELYSQAGTDKQKLDIIAQSLRLK